MMLRVGNERRKCAKKDPSHLVTVLIVLERKAAPKRQVVNVYNNICELVLASQ